MATARKPAQTKFDIAGLTTEFVRFVETSCEFEGSIVEERSYYGIKPGDKLRVPAEMPDKSMGWATMTVEQYFVAQWKNGVSRDFVPDFSFALQTAITAGTVMSNRHQATAKQALHGRSIGDKFSMGYRYWTPENKAYQTRTAAYRGKSPRGSIKAIW